MQQSTLKPVASDSNLNRTESVKNRGRRSSHVLARGYSYNTAIEGRLTASQRKALLNSWYVLKHRGAQGLMNKIFGNLANDNGKVKDIVCKAAVVNVFKHEPPSAKGVTWNDHGASLVKLLDDVICNLDQSERTMDEVNQLGRQHASLRKSGLSGIIWESFGELALAAIAKQDGIKHNTEAVKAWTVLIACITDELRTGFEHESRNSAFNASPD